MLTAIINATGECTEAEQYPLPPVGITYTYVIWRDCAVVSGLK